MAEQWVMEGPYIKTCNCDPGCPCDFNQMPTHGSCHGCAAMRIDSGHSDGLSLDGLAWILLARWPGRIDEGDGEIQFVIDERADPDQRSALESILSGSRGGALFEILDMVCPHKRPAVFAPIGFDFDLDRRTALVTAGELFETTVESLVGFGDPPPPYEVRVSIPNGFEYVNERGEAQIALATRLRAATQISMEETDGHASLCHSRFSGS